MRHADEVEATGAGGRVGVRQRLTGLHFVDAEAEHLRSALRDLDGLFGRITSRCSVRFMQCAPLR